MLVQIDIRPRVVVVVDHRRAALQNHTLAATNRNGVAFSLHAMQQRENRVKFPYNPAVRTEGFATPEPSVLRFEYAEPFADSGTDSRIHESKYGFKYQNS